jgi:acyl-coenzyme A synthetase/AMP-(fatty) acid ligase
VEGAFNPESWFRLIQDYGITCFVGTPTIYRMLMTVKDAEKRFDLSNWQRAVSAGESLPADTFQSTKERFGIEVLDGIGMSESMVYCFNMIGQPVKPGSTGRPAPGTVIKILDHDLDQVEPGSSGVLSVRRDTHAGIMKGYWNKPLKTTEILRGDWYYSGDVYVQDEDGYFWFIGREDDLMKCSGYRISPFEVESVSLTHPVILEAAAVESPDEVRGRVVKAFIVLKEGIEDWDGLAREIQEYVKQNTAPYKYPRKVEFVDNLPKTQSGKIRRRLLRESELAKSRGLGHGKP